MRFGAQLLAAGLLPVVVGVSVNQVLNDGRWSWVWLFAALAVSGVAASITFLMQREMAGSGGARTTTRHYVRQVRGAVSDMETLGVARQSEFVLTMREAYIDLALRPRPPRDDPADEVGDGASEARTLQDFLGEGRVYAVLGSSGSGKTTLVRHAALTLCDGERFRRRRRIPLLLYLRDHLAALLGEEPPGLAGLAAMAGWLAGRVEPRWIEHRLERSRCVVLLDGLDEVVDARDRRAVVTWIRRQVQRFPGNDWVVTSRPDGYLSHPLPNAEVLRLQRFSGAQVARFVHSWYLAYEQRARSRSGAEVRERAAANADELVSRILESPALVELAANPLLLTMIANVHRNREALPHSRADLFHEMCDVLLHRRPEAKDLHDLTGLSGHAKEIVLRHLAADMMSRRIRDIGVEDARSVVAIPLRTVADEGAVDPGVFLRVAVRSGLLVERESGMVQFTHLTFQEYLAAAHIRARPVADLRLLVEGIDHLWWRETSLLWAALGDATALIEACLESGTARALTLAFDCLDEARQVQPETRVRLHARMTPDTDNGGADVRLVAAVTAARSLRRFLWLDGALPLCVEPVGRELYTLYTGRTAAEPDGFATGLWPVDVRGFLDWLNGLFDDGTRYRLPTREELAHPDAARIPALESHTVWVGQPPVLHRPDKVPWPLRPGEAAIGAFRENVHRRARLALHLTRAASGSVALEPHRVVAYIHLLRPDGGGSSTVDHLLATNLDLAWDLASDLRRTLTLAGEAGRGLDATRGISSDLDRLVRLTLPFGGAHGLDQVGVLSRELAEASDRTDPDSARLLAITGDLHAALSRALTRSLGRAADDADGTARDLALDLDRALVLTRARDHDRELAGGMAEDLVTVTVDPGDEGLLLARDLAKAVEPYQRDLLATSVTVFGCLLRCWSATGAGRRGTGAGRRGLLRSLEGFVNGLLDGLAEEFAHASADPVANLRQVLTGLGDLGEDPDIRRLIEHAESSMAPVFARETQVDPVTLHLAGAELLAAIGLLRMHGAGRSRSATLLAEALGAVILWSGNGRDDANDVILLVQV
ncbi:NACHT domain-containing protein [Actinomadura soli]|uniref:NACHT domain-containing protein n=1 Tax=Actinomadura soli TaxID=2508997 RepID=A0A5C4JDQ5_9ACTN|nr:NACHT domain-containing protein [Actinomadura soli]TMR02261.1 NACHT domain-containing protein [Actinomadura soli]